MYQNLTRWVQYGKISDIFLEAMIWILTSSFFFCVNSMACQRKKPCNFQIEPNWRSFFGKSSYKDLFVILWRRFWKVSQFDQMLIKRRKSDKKWQFQTNVESFNLRKQTTFLFIRHETKWVMLSTRPILGNRALVCVQKQDKTWIWDRKKGIPQN